MKQARRQRQSGVTLIELLIAVTLVALLAVGMLIAMRVGLGAMDKANSKLTANRRAAGIEKIIEAEIGGVIPVQAKCLPTADWAALSIPFFQGDPQSMRLVSNFSLQQGSRGFPMILEFQVITGEENRGVRLIVNEHVYTGPTSAGAFCAGQALDATGMMQPIFLPIEAGSSSFVLADKLAYCRFSYRFLPPQVNPMMPAPGIWLSHWPKRFLPTAIRIEMAPIDPDSNKVQPLTLSIPVRVTRDPMKTDYEF